MSLLEKFQVLGTAASWDSCGSVKQKSYRKAGIPEKYSSFIHDCSATSENCKLVKVLQTNSCTHDCKYCLNSCKNKKTFLEPEELAQGFISLYKNGLVNGLFLSSGVSSNADLVAERMIESARLLRNRFNFKGYLHLKVLPTMSKHLVFEMAELADRLSLNLEVPNKERFSELGSTKNYDSDLQKRFLWINEAKQKGILSSYTTQFILGAAQETDAELLEKISKLYEKTQLYRSYFSSFVPLKGTALEKKPAERKLRGFQFYQTDWLLRVYNYSKKEIDSALLENGMFGNARDIKFSIACNNPENFPVDIETASKEELLRVPGIGPKTTDKILSARETKKLDANALKMLGIAAKRALPFLSVNGNHQKRIKEFS